MVHAVAPLTDLTTWVRGRGLEIVLFVLGAVLLTRAVRWLGWLITRRIDARSTRGTELIRSETAKHSHAATQMFTWLVVALIYSVTAVLVLQRLNVPITGLVAPAAVVGVALGFGAQRLVQDVLAGLFIIVERQYGFGDVVRISALGSETGVTGTVEEVTLRITRLRNLNGEVVIVANGQIVQVTNLSRDWARAVVDVPVSTTADVQQVRDILHRVGMEAYNDEDLRPLLLDSPSVLGVESLQVGALHLRMVARTLPGKQFDVGRELRARVAVAFQEEGIAFPADLATAEPVGAS
jgi:moderate conductance mechanosensitive channel